ALAVGIVRPGRRDRPGQLDGLRDATDRDVAADGDLLSGALDLTRLERQLGMALGVEEVRGLEVNRKVLVLDVEAGDAGRAREALRQLRIYVCELALE